MGINSCITKTWLQTIFLKYYNNPNIVIGILRIVAKFKSNEIYPECYSMALSAIAHENSKIQECGIRAFEHWKRYDSLSILKSVNVKSGWLRDYLLKVIENIERKYAFIKLEK